MVAVHTEVIAYESPEDASNATTWALQHLRGLLSGGNIGYREAAERTLAACKARGVLPDIADTITLMGFMEAGRRFAHHTRKPTGYRRPLTNTSEDHSGPIAIETKVRVVAEGKAQCLLTDWQFMIPNVGMVPLGEMTRGMVWYQRNLYYRQTRTNAAYARFFDRIATRMDAVGDEDATVGQVLGEEEVVTLAENVKIL